VELLPLALSHEAAQLLLRLPKGECAVDVRLLIVGAVHELLLANNRVEYTSNIKSLSEVLEGVAHPPLVDPAQDHALRALVGPSLPQVHQRDLAVLSQLLALPPCISPQLPREPM
jgi:hypothetical protein